MQDETDSGIANSFTDLMTSLMVIFVLLLCASMNNAFEQGQSTRTKILEKLGEQLKEFVVKGVTVESDPNDPLALLILVPEGLLQFQLNRSDIPQKGVEFLNSFVPIFTNTIYDDQFRNDISSVVVEGHTDTSGDDSLNLKLSQDRSMAVVSKFINILDTEIENSSTQANNKKDYFLRVLSASGRGEQDRIMINGGEDHALSRRVVFKIRVRSFEERKLEKRLSHG